MGRDLRVDPDSLEASGKVARRQYQHIESIKSYISSTCHQFEAFTGVMDLFQGTYQSALDSVSDGLEKALDVSTKTERSFNTTADDYRDTDRRIYEKAKQHAIALHGPGVDFPPYRSPGSGETSPGGPIMAPMEPPKEPKDWEFPDLPGLKLRDLAHVQDRGETVEDAYDTGAGAGKMAADGILSHGTKVEAPGWLDPVGAAKDWVKGQVTDTAFSMAHRDEYMDLRNHDMSHQEAMQELERRHGVDGYMAQHDQGEVSDNRSDAYDRAYHSAQRDATADGASPDDAKAAGREAGREASSQSADETRGEHKARDRATGALGDARALKDGVDDAISNVKSAGQHVDHIVDNVQDAKRYEDYEDKPHDDSVEKWAEDTSGEDWAK